MTRCNAALERFLARLHEEHLPEAIDMALSYRENLIATSMETELQVPEEDPEQSLPG